MHIAGVASSAFVHAANFIKKRPEQNNALPESETLEEKTKRMIIDDQEEWLKFQDHLRKKGVATSVATRESLIACLSMRRSEQAINESLKVWEK